MASKLGPSLVDLAWEKGHEEGWEAGELQANRATLTALLRDKFGRLPRKFQKQIDTCTDAGQLLRPICRAAKCASLADFKL